MAGLLFSGEVYIDFLNTDYSSTGFVPPLNCSNLTIQVQDPDEKTVISTQTATYGMPLTSVYIPKPQKLSFTINEVDSEFLARSLAGSLSAFSQTAVAPASPISVTLHKDKWVSVGKLQCTAMTIDGETLNTDFKVNLNSGLIMALSPSLDNVVKAVKVTAPQKNYDKITGGTTTSFPIKLMLNGINRVDGKAGTLDVPLAIIAPSGDFDALAGEIATVTFKGTIMLKPGETQMYTWLLT